MLGTSSSAEGKRRGSTPRVESASVLSCTAFRSFSNNTITMATPSSICGIGPRKVPEAAHHFHDGLLVCKAPFSTAHNASEKASS